MVDRTAQLTKLNENLLMEIEERMHIEDSLKVTNAILLQRNSVMETELDMARNIQKRMIPETSPNPDIAFFYQPMDKVGGDFYDFIEISHQDATGIFISDVSGHGVPAAFVTSMIKSALLQLAPVLRDPADLLFYLNGFLISQTNGNFVTALYGIYFRKTREFVFSNAGHHPPIVIDEAGARFAQAEGRGIPLAIADQMILKAMGKEYTNRTILLKPNSKLFLCTDGLLEAKDKSGSDKDFEQSGLLELLNERKNLPSEKFIETIASELFEFHGSDQFDDDVCLICLDVK